MISRIEYASGYSNVGTPSVMTATLTQPVLAGDTLVVTTFCGLTGDTPTISDTGAAGGSQTYVNLSELTQFQTHGETGMWVVLSSLPGVTSVTATLNAADNRGGIIVAHYRGLAAIDQHPAVGGANSNQAWTSPAITTTRPSLIVVNNEAYLGGTAGQFPVCNAPFATQVQIPTSGNGGAFDGNNGNMMCLGDYIADGPVSGFTASGTSPTGITWNYTIIADFTPPILNRPPAGGNPLAVSGMSTSERRK